MEKKPVRRVVTGHDEQGKAVVLIDAPTPYVNQRGEGNVVQLLWINNETPADLSHTRDQAAQKTGVPPPRNGAILRVVDFAPYDGKVPQGIDHHEILKQMGIDPATFFAKVVYTGSHENAVLALKSNTVDVAFNWWNSETDSNLTRMANKGMVAASEFKIVFRSDLIAGSPNALSGRVANA